MYETLSPKKCLTNKQTLHTYPAYINVCATSIFFVSRLVIDAVVRDDVGPATAGGGGMQYPRCLVLLATIFSSSSVDNNANDDAKKKRR